MMGLDAAGKRRFEEIKADFSWRQHIIDEIPLAAEKEMWLAFIAKATAGNERFLFIRRSLNGGSSYSTSYDDMVINYILTTKLGLSESQLRNIVFVPSNQREFVNPRTGKKWMLYHYQ